MPKELTYAQQRARDLTILTRDALHALPIVCTDFIRAIEPTTQPLTRYAYTQDLRLFFKYLSEENPRFHGQAPDKFQIEDLNVISARDIEMFLDYLSLYFKPDDTEVTNAELGKMRKLSTLRSFYKYLFKHELVDANVASLIDMPKRHQKPIIRLEIDEVARLLDAAESTEALSTKHQNAYNAHTRKRDLAILTLFLGTGIRVSELVGINIDDLDFDLNGFIVTRKGGAQAILYFPDEVAAVLKEYLKDRKEIVAREGDEKALFLSLQKRRISVRAVEMMVKKYTNIAAPLKKHLSPHKLRSTFGSNLYHETGDIYLVADVLGHSDINTTRRHYAAMADDRRRMAAKVVKLRDDAPEQQDGNDGKQD